MPGNDQTALPVVDLTKAIFARGDTDFLVNYDPLTASPIIDLSKALRGEPSFYVNFSPFSSLLPTGTTQSNTVVISTTITYRMRGYYVVGAAFEFWTTTTPFASPPSGHSLIDTTIIGSYTT